MKLHQMLVVLLLSVVLPTVCVDVSIVGGKEVKKPKPWLVSVQVFQQHLCGGTLIQKQWVLTAAHCLEASKSQAPHEPLTVLLGSHSLTKGKHAQRIEVLSHYIPKTFSKKLRRDDIMLLKLKVKAQLKRKTVAVMSLPKSGKDVPPGTKCEVSGWGSTSEHAKTASDTLQEVEVMVIDRKLCNYYYNRNPVITEDMLCAGNTQGHKDACQGDSGGPLECKKTIVGLVSGGSGCGNPKKPGVYTLLSKKHLSWINSVIKSQNNNQTKV